MFNVMKNFPKIVILPLLIILAGIVTFIVGGGFKTDIDFAGGTIMQLNMEQDFDIGEVKTVIKDTTGKDADSVQKASNAAAAHQVIIKMQTLSADERTSLYTAIKEKFNLQNSYEDSIITSENITPLVSSEIIYNALLAVAIASILILLYVTIRFTFASGIAAIVALINDVLIMLSLYSICRIPVNASFIAAILTIIGYSINSTIVVFDRIRENKKFAKQGTFADVCEKSIWQTMRRTLNTTGTTVVTLIILAIMGEDSIRAFAIPLIVGVLSGAYTSSFIAAPIWNMIEGGDLKRKPGNVKTKKKPA